MNLNNEQIQFISNTNLDYKIQKVIEFYIQNDLQYENHDLEFLKFVQSTWYDSKLRESILCVLIKENKMTERSVATQEEMLQMREDAMNTFMKENAGKTIEVPVNLLYALSQFLNATGNMLDEGRQPYPSMQWSCNALGYLLLEKFVPFRDRIPGTLYTVYDTIHEVNTRNERDIDIDELMKWFESGEK